MDRVRWWSGEAVDFSGLLLLLLESETAEEARDRFGVDEVEEEPLAVSVLTFKGILKDKALLSGAGPGSLSTGEDDEEAGFAVVAGAGSFVELLESLDDSPAGADFSRWDNVVGGREGAGGLFCVDGDVRDADDESDERGVREGAGSGPFVSRVNEESVEDLAVPACCDLDSLRDCFCLAGCDIGLVWTESAMFFFDSGVFLRMSLMQMTGAEKGYLVVNTSKWNENLQRKKAACSLVMAG